jgi:hypothetical protein
MSPVDGRARLNGLPLALFVGNGDEQVTLIRNVDANYRFERSHRFAGIQPISGFGDYSRLSCGVGDTQLGRRPGSRQGCLRGRHQPSSGGFPGSGCSRADDPLAPPRGLAT